MATPDFTTVKIILPFYFPDKLILEIHCDKVNGFI